MWYMWQLSLEGPLFKMIGRCGKSCGKGRCASRTKLPKNFKAKAVSTSEIVISWTPQLPANPFHDQFYIFSWRKVSDNGAESWQEEILDRGDYSKFDEKAAVEIGKPSKLKWHFKDLATQTAYQIRFCVEGPKGRCEWSKEHRVSTFAEPNPKEDFYGGLSGPLASEAPTTVKEYHWSQSKHEVVMKFSIPDDWKGKDITCKVNPTTIDIRHTKGLLLKGTMGGKVRNDEVDWILEAGKDKEGKEFILTLRKEKVMQKWACFIDSDDHQKIDVELLQLFHDGNAMNELGTRDIWED
eukprot:CAMPEP_0169105262 /NCGR_PEP_ID=MMETSP1015-20121227/23695_1 /TAXON_ID=342587 /ORGANISM="Karlodinium micrum, Strain CCMP2283" /LENGTH=295 /DNA_ID=CAMNT_0009166595 /DNA_START=198 /DNA_END=1085 /DNA_ORIENTATION=+